MKEQVGHGSKAPSSGMHVGNWSRTPESLGWESNTISARLSTLVTEQVTLSPWFTSLHCKSFKYITIKQGEVPLPPTHWEKPLGRTVEGSVVINLPARGTPRRSVLDFPVPGVLLSPLMTNLTDPTHILEVPPT